MAANKRPAVVVARLSALGDVVMTIPVVYNLARSNPDLTVVVVTRDRMATMFENDAPANLEVKGIDLKKDYKGPRGMFRLVSELSNEYDIRAFVDLHDVLRTRLMRLFMLLRGKRVTHIDKGRADKRKLVRIGADAFGKKLEPTVDRYEDAIRRAGITIKPHFNVLYENVESKEGRRVGIAPFAAHKGKVYPLDRMREVVDKLASLPDTTVYLFGAGEAEKSVLAEWVAGRDNVVNMADKNIGLAAEMKLMATLDVMVAMDSGNMHMASVSGTPHVVSIWGATHPAAGFIPWHVNSDDFVQLSMSCRPCSIYGNAPCRFSDYRCITSIMPDMIVDKVIKYL